MAIVLEGRIIAYYLNTSSEKLTDGQVLEGRIIAYYLNLKMKSKYLAKSLRVELLLII